MGGTFFSQSLRCFGRFTVLPLLVALTLGPIPARAEFCANWRMGEGVGTSVGDCMAQAQDSSRNRADDARRRGAADQQRSREAGVVADKLESDKGQATARYQSPAMNQQQKAQFAQQQYRLRTPYAEKYTELSRYLEVSTSRSLPRLPSSNEQLMKFDTSPLRELQKDQQAEADKLLQQAKQAYAAMGNFQQLGGIARGRERAMHSMPNIASVAANRAGKTGSGGLEGSTGTAKEDAGGGEKSVTIGGAIRNDGSTISRRVDAFQAGPAGKRQTGEEKKEKVIAGKNGKTGPPEADPSDKAFARMEEARKLFEQKLDDVAKGRVKEQPKSAVESFLEEVSKPSAGRQPASIVASGELPTANTSAQPANSETEGSSPAAFSLLDAPDQLQAADSIFTLVTRQYRKRQQELGSPSADQAVTARLDD